MGASSGQGSFVDFWSFDPVTKEWIQLQSFPGMARAFAFGIGIGQLGLVGLGSNDGIDIWSFHPEINKWEPQPDFPGTIRTDAAAFGIGEQGYVGTGNPGGLIEFWQLQP